MNPNKFLKKLLAVNSQRLITSIFFFIFFILGLSIYKDYGISVDEPFQRSLGYYWYIHLLELFSDNSELINTVQEKFETMYWSNHLNEGKLIQYGIFFDTLAVFLEEISNIKGNQNIFFFKHLLTFFLFFLSSIFFYKITFERFKNNFYSIIFTFFYLSSPRIFAESFYNSKDIVFMSLTVCALYFALKSFFNFNYKNLFFFSLFAALATNVRIMGIFVFGLFFVFLLLSCLEEKYFFKKKYCKNYFFKLFLFDTNILILAFFVEFSYNKFYFYFKIFCKF